MAQDTNVHTIYILLYNDEYTLHSNYEHFGVAVTTETEAIRFTKEGFNGHPCSYDKIQVFANKDDAIKTIDPTYKT